MYARVVGSIMGNYYCGKTKDKQFIAYNIVLLPNRKRILDSQWNEETILYRVAGVLHLRCLQF